MSASVIANALQKPESSLQWAAVATTTTTPLAKTINGLYKAELIHRRAPWKTRKSVELATLEWIAWFNQKRPLSSIGYIPPAEAEAEANSYNQLGTPADQAVLL